MLEAQVFLLKVHQIYDQRYKSEPTETGTLRKSCPLHTAHSSLPPRLLCPLVQANDSMARRKPTSRRLDKMLSGGGGGYSLPPIKEARASDHGFGTYRGKSNNIATVGLELPVLNIGKNPPGYHSSNRDASLYNPRATREEEGEASN